MSPDDCVHLSVADILELHAAVIEAFGGAPGVRDLNLLEAAAAAPRATASGESPFADLVEVAAAYLFYLCRNHPFNDGNKRAAMGAAIVFLRLNGIEPAADSSEWENLVMEVAASHMDREATTMRLRALVVGR